MHLFFSYLEVIVYLIAFTLMFKAVRILTGGEYGSIRHLKTQGYRSVLNNLNKTLKSYIHKDSTEKLFKDAGFPLQLTGFRFTALRLAFLFGGTSLSIIKWSLNSTPFPYSNIGLVIAIYFLTSTKDYMPMVYLLKKIQRLNNLDKNRECFLLYSMLLNEFHMDDGRPYNLYSVLLKFSSYFVKIKPALYKCIAMWKRSPDHALDLFAAEIGTEEAYDLVQILKSVDAANVDQARDIIKSRYEQFQTNRHEQHRRTLKNLDLIGYIIVIVPTIAILFNMVFVLGIAVQNLLERVNYH